MFQGCENGEDMETEEKERTYLTQTLGLNDLNKNSTTVEAQCLWFSSNLWWALFRSSQPHLLYITLTLTCVWCCIGDNILKLVSTSEVSISPERGMKLSDYDRVTPSICRASIVTYSVVL